MSCKFYFQIALSSKFVPVQISRLFCIGCYTCQIMTTIRCKKRNETDENNVLCHTQHENGDILLFDKF